MGHVRFQWRRERRNGRAQEEQHARARWGFLTPFDLSTIMNEVQLVSMVKDRTGIGLVQARQDVHGWMQGKHF
jgi:hypothetical protein